jgi:hypothetical protein
MAELSVAIRIFWKTEKLNFGTGAGITFSSDSQHGMGRDGIKGFQVNNRLQQDNTDEGNSKRFISRSS